MDQTLTRLVNTTSGSYSRSAVNRKLRRKRGGGRGRGEGVETLAHQNIMLQRNTEPENARSTSNFMTDWSFRLSSDLMRPAVFQRIYILFGRIYDLILKHWSQMRLDRR